MIGLESTIEDHRLRRELLHTPVIVDFISGAMIYEELLYQNVAHDTQNFDALKSKWNVSGTEKRTLC